MAERKSELRRKPQYFIFHILITLLTLSLLLILWQWDLWLIVLIITVSHLIIDILKINLSESRGSGKKKEALELWIFLADQFLHLVIIFLLWLLFSHQFQIFFSEISITFSNIKIWWCILAYVFLTVPSSVLIGKVTNRWSKQVESIEKQEIRGLLFAGKWIGIFERLLIFTFILIDQFSGVGFLLAAKSVFRFGDLKNSTEHMKTEYIILGTLLSFSIAIFSGLLIQTCVLK